MPKLDPKHKMIKPFSTQIKELNSEEGVVVAYANVYSNEDWDGDISEPGSFVKTVDENTKKLRVYKNHNSDIELGVPSQKPDAKDAFGLLTTTQFNLEKEVSRDMLSDIKLKMKYGKDVDLSIGFQIVKRDEKDRRKITEYALWEYSFLTNWGANALATVLTAKSFKAEQDRINHVMNFLTDAYNLKYSDGRLIKLETLLKSLSEEPGADPLLVEPTAEQIKLLLLNAFN
jgi:HK97 family phage prohead protease